MTIHQTKLIGDPLWSLATGALMPQMVTDQALAERLVSLANSGDTSVCNLLDMLASKDTSPTFLEELAEAVFDVEVPHYISFDKKTGQFRWAMRGQMTRDATKALRNAGPAFAIIRLYQSRFLNRLKRCELVDCRVHFVGDPRSRWCSKKCGSLYRVTLKRNPKRARSMI